VASGETLEKINIGGSVMTIIWHGEKHRRSAASKRKHGENISSVSISIGVWQPYMTYLIMLA